MAKFEILILLGVLFMLIPLSSAVVDYEIINPPYDGYSFPEMQDTYLEIEVNSSQAVNVSSVIGSIYFSNGTLFTGSFLMATNVTHYKTIAFPYETSTYYVEFNVSDLDGTSLTKSRNYSAHAVIVGGVHISTMTMSIPPITEVRDLLLQGASASVVFKAWNPPVYEELTKSFTTLFAATSFDSLGTTIFQITGLFIKYVMREPASLVKPYGT